MVKKFKSKKKNSETNEFGSLGEHDVCRQCAEPSRKEKHSCTKAKKGATRCKSKAASIKSEGVVGWKQFDKEKHNWLVKLSPEEQQQKLLTNLTETTLESIMQKNIAM